MRGCNGLAREAGPKFQLQNCLLLELRNTQFYLNLAIVGEIRSAQGEQAIFSGEVHVKFFFHEGPAHCRPAIWGGPVREVGDQWGSGKGSLFAPPGTYFR